MARRATTVAALAATAAMASAQNATYLGFFENFHAAFTSVSEYRGQTSLFVTSFGVRDRTHRRANKGARCARMRLTGPWPPRAFTPAAPSPTTQRPCR